MNRPFAAAILIAIAALSAPARANAAPLPEKPEIAADAPASRSYNKEIECLTAAIYFEAGGEPVRGQNMVAQVVLNRVESRFYPDSVCDVVYQNAHRRNACQFSFACDDLTDEFSEPAAHAMARKIAVFAFNCDEDCKASRGEIAQSTHYHADYVAPFWSKKLQKTGKVGSHIFYYTASM
jgi:spore germination cell wall hydrolase CwlJ-like protein